MCQRGAILALLVLAVVCDTTEGTLLNSDQLEGSALSARQALNEIEELFHAMGPAVAPLEELIEEDPTAAVGQEKAASQPAQQEAQVQKGSQQTSEQQQGVQQRQAAQQRQQLGSQQQQQLGSQLQAPSQQISQQQAPLQQAASQQTSQQQAPPQQTSQQQAPPQQTSQGRPQSQETKPVQAPQQQAQQQVTGAQAQQPVVVQQQTGTAVPVQAPAVAPAAAPAPPTKSKAQEFNSLVTEVNTLLDDAIGKLKKDKDLFKQASEDQASKLSELKEQANSAKQDANGNTMLMDAIETNRALAAKEGAKAFISFAENFRKSAEDQFLKSYSSAEDRQSKLQELYEDITSHVANAVKQMQSNGQKIESQYMEAVKAFYKTHYKLKYRCEKEKDDKKEDDCMAPVKKAKAEMKSAKQKLSDFKDNLQTAHHHGRKLRKRLKHALHKLTYVFRKARKALRRAKEGFHAGFDMHYSAQKAVSHSALVALKKAALKKANPSHTDKAADNKKAADDKEVKKEAKKAAVEAAKKEVKKEAHQAAIRAARHSKAAAAKHAEMTAIHSVQKAAKAILKTQKTRASTMMQTKSKTQKLSKKQLRAEKKAIGIVAKAITSMSKKSASTGQVGEVLEAVVENSAEGAEDDFEEDEELLQVPKYITSEEDLDAYLKQQGSTVVEDNQGVPEDELSEQDQAELHEAEGKTQGDDMLMQVLPEDGDWAYRP